MIIAPSILNVKEEELNNKLKLFSDAGIMYLHLDIMDGKFVPNTTNLKSILPFLKEYDFVIDTHLMVENPLEVSKEFIEAGSDIITFHFEATKDPLGVIKLLKQNGLKVGISIKPNTDIKVLYPYLEMIDQVLIMSVEPGFGGQSFLSSAYEKVEKLAFIRNNKKDLAYQIEVDGGINLENAKALKDLGANIVVMGTSLLKLSKEEVKSWQEQLCA